MASGLKIYGPRPALDEMTSSAGAFTASDSGAAAHLRYILLEAKDGVLTVTAESSLGAIRFTPEGVSVEGEGRLMVRHNMLATALAVFEPSQSPVLDYDGSKNVIHISADRTETNLVTGVIGENAILPSIGELSTDNGMSVAPEEFIEWYSALAPFRNSGSKPSVAGVFGYMDEDDENIFRGICMDGGTASSLRQLKVNPIGEGMGKILLENEGISRAMQFFKKGAKVDFHLDEQLRRLHMMVRTKDELKYHMWTPLLNVKIEDFPAVAVLRGMDAFAKSAQISVKMSKSDMLQLMRNAAAIGALSPVQSDGASRFIEIDLYEDTFRASAGKQTDASYQDDRPATVMPLDTEVRTRFAFGPFGHLIETYHNPEDPEMVRFCLARKGERVVAAMFHFSDNIFDENGVMDDSVMMIPMAQLQD